MTGRVRYLDVCAGISASTVAWKPLGWEAAAYSEIEAAPRAILAHHYPDTPLHGDFTTIRGDEYGPIDLLVGGTPCQDFSVAGLRAGLDGDRGNLSLEFLRLADRCRPRWVVWENVPGVLSINGGRAFGAILGGLGQLGYGFAYRVLDAQFAGVPQRRRRVFVVGYLGDWRRAAAVLLERHSLSGHPAPRRQVREGAADCPGGRAVNVSDGCPRLDDVSGTLNTAMRRGSAQNSYVAHALRGEGFDGSEDGTGRGTPLVPVPFVQNSRDEVRVFGDGHSVGALAAEPGAKQQCYIAFDCKGTQVQVEQGGGHPTLRSMGHANSHSNAGGHAAAMVGSAVRRLTPRECERLQGFPDDYTLVPHRGKPMADGPRYKALGNSMAVPVMRWIGERIAAVDALPQQDRIAA